MKMQYIRIGNTDLQPGYSTYVLNASDREVNIVVSNKKEMVKPVVIMNTPISNDKKEKTVKKNNNK